MSLKRSRLTRKAWLKRGPGPKRKTRLNPVNRKRKKKRHRDNFGPKAEWIRSLPCVCCGGRDRVEAAHARSRGAGGTSEHLVPLQHVCHRYQHQVGIKTFQSERGVDLMDEAARLHDEWTSQEEA